MYTLLIGSIFSIIIMILYEFSMESPELFLGGHFLFSLCNLVATSFIASSIFYYIHSYYPEKKIKKISLINIEPYLINLIRNLNLILYWFESLIIIKNDGTIQIKNGNYLSSSPIHSINNYNSNFDLSKDLTTTIKTINKEIISIKETGLLQNLDLDLNLNLNNLLFYFNDHSKFYFDILFLIKVSNIQNTESNFFEFETPLLKIKLVYNSIDKYLKENSHEYRILINYQR